MTTMKFNAGILACAGIREYLESLKFEGVEIEWREGRGWFRREWIVKGQSADIHRIHRDLMSWAKENELPA